MESIVTANRNQVVDIGKGIAIILMCVGHSYVCSYIDTFIYLFHMAFFFMMSGYFFRERNLDNPKRFLWKRIKGLYFPFVKWGVVFVLLHNLFTTVGINSASAGFYTFREMAHRALLTNTRFIPTEECMGPFWFLSCLFLVSIYAFGVFYVNRKFKYKKYAIFATFFIFYFIGFLLLYIFQESSTLSFYIRVFVVGGIFYLGYLIGSKYQQKINYKSPTLILASFLLLCMGVLGGQNISIPECEFSGPIGFIVFSISGCFLILGISSYMAKCSFMAKSLAFIGEHTLAIFISNMFLRRLYFLLLFKVEYQGRDFYSLNLQDTLQWWDSLGCTVFMVIVPIMVILLKNRCVICFKK